MDDLDQKKTIRRSLANGTFRATHYGSYHSYRRANRIAKGFLYAAAIFALISLLPFIIFRGMALSITFFCVMTYLIFDYWVSSKSQQMKKDSASVIKEVSAYTKTKSKIKAWHIYDGIYSGRDEDSLEISFVYERTFINNIWKLIKGQKKTWPLDSDNIKELKYFVSKQQEAGQFLIYATLTETMAYNLSRRGFQLKELPHKYCSKPNRWDYAVTTGRMGNALWGFPRRFDAYLIEINETNAEIESKMKAFESLKKQAGETLKFAFWTDKLISKEQRKRDKIMIITFFTRDGQFTTDKFATINDAKDYLEEAINPIMIEDIESTGADRAAIFIPKATISIIPIHKLHKKRHSTSRPIYRVVKKPEYHPNEPKTINRINANLNKSLPDEISKPIRFVTKEGKVVGNGTLYKKGSQFKILGIPDNYKLECEDDVEKRMQLLYWPDLITVKLDNTTANSKSEKSDKSDDVRIANDPDDVTWNDDDEHGKAWNKLLFEKMNVGGEQYLDMFTKNKDDENWRLAYNFFEKHIDVLYEDPEWKEFRLVWDQIHKEQ